AFPDAVIVATDDGCITAVNDRLCALARYARDDLVGKPVEALVPAGRRAQHVALRSAYIAGGGGTIATTSRSDIMLLRSDGFEVPVDIALSTVSYEGRLLVVATIR